MGAQDDPEARIRALEQPPNGQQGGQISVAGVGDNKVTYKTGSPEINSGGSNTVGRG